MAVEQSRAGGNEIMIPFAQVPLGRRFKYLIAYERNELSVSIDGGDKRIFSTYQLYAPGSYFKAGNYNHGETESEVHFFAIEVQHRI